MLRVPDGTRGLARRTSAGMRAGSQLAGGGSGLVGPQAAVNFGCPASCGGTHPSEFRHKNDAPCFRAGQARGSSCKLSGFDFTSAPVYCHVCFWRPAPQCAAWCCMPTFLANPCVVPPAGLAAVWDTHQAPQPKPGWRPHLRLCPGSSNSTVMQGRTDATHLSQPAALHGLQSTKPPRLGC